MSVELAKAHLRKYGREGDVLEFDVSTATVELAAQAVGVEPARIAKSLSFHGRGDNSNFLVITAGDAKIDNKKFRTSFGLKARMFTAEEALETTGHAVGGVCPFGIPEDVPVYLDESMKRFDTLFPAVGSANSAIELTCEDFITLCPGSSWVDVCKINDSEEAAAC